MPKTVIQYEKSDVDIKNNPMHKAVHVAVMLGALSFITPDKTIVDETTRREDASANAVALFLTALENGGFTVTRKETVPPVFDEYFRGPLSDPS